MTRYAIGDIHGGAKTFQALLDKIGLNLADRLYLLGDYIDRGPDSRGVLDIILKLMDGGFDVRPVRGNHEDMLLQSIYSDDAFLKSWIDVWATETLKSFGVKSSRDIPVRYIDLLEQMPYTWSDDNFVFVHAGLDMTMDDPLTESGPLAMLWGENTPSGKNRLNGRTLVTGHKIRPIPMIELSLLTDHYQLDNGAFCNMQPNFGNLVALNLDTRELIIQPWCDGPTD